MKILDRYVIRETLGPFALALTLFTFLMQTRPMLDRAQDLLSKGLDVPTVARLLVLLLPQALGITLPMAFLAGSLMALGRLSGDREGVSLLACGVSPHRILRPVLLMAVVVGGLDMYTLMYLVPKYNQQFRVETFNILVKQSEGDIKPGLFYEGFPGKMLYVRERIPGTTHWSGVILADTSQPTRTATTFAESGYLDIDQDKQTVTIVLEGESRRYVPGENGVYEETRAQNVRIAVPKESIFGDEGLSIAPGLAEKTIPELRKDEEDKRKNGVSPHPEIMQRHQMFSFPTACLVFALVALSLGLHTRKEGMLGGFALGIAVTFLYYGLMEVGTSLAKGHRIDPAWARWIPNIVLGALGIAAIRWRNLSAGREIALTIPTWLSTAIRRRRQTGGEHRAPERIRVVIRFPDVQLPMPRILDLYVGRRYLSVAMLCFFGMLGLYYISTLIDKSERLAKGQATLPLLLQYFYYSTPQFIAYVVPMAILVAVLATVGTLVRSGELIVMRACGVSLYRAAAPLLVLALVWSGGLFLLDDRVLARANRKAAALDDQIRGSSTPEAPFLASNNWRAGTDGRIYFYGLLNIGTQTIYNVSIFDTATGPYRLTSQSYIQQATYEKTAWRTHKGWAQRFPETGRATRQSFDSRLLRFDGPEFFKNAAKDPEMMTFTELKGHILELRDSGLNLAASKVTLQERIAFPMVTVVMTLLGIPFGVTTGRRGALYGIGLAVILGSGYWLANTFFLAVGQAALLPPALAAWATNILFLTAALYMTFTVRT